MPEPDHQLRVSAFIPVESGVLRPSKIFELLTLDGDLNDGSHNLMRTS